MSNRVTDVLRVRYPLIMGGVGQVQLAAAVSNAGGLGCLVGSVSPDQLRENIHTFRASSERPFCVNIALALNPQDTMQAKMDVIMEEGVPIVVTSAGSPGIWTDMLHDAGALVAHVVPTVYHAQKAAGAGVDLVIAEPVESGGYRGDNEVSMMVLVPGIRRALPDIPLVAAGAVADRAGYVAVRSLGADGVQLGTRLIATEEAGYPAHYAKLILAAEDTSTMSAEGRVRPRVSKPELAERVLGESRRVQMGQVAALIDRVASVQEVVTELFHGGAEHAKAIAADLDAVTHEVSAT